MPEELNSNQLLEDTLNKYVTELIGTFFLVLTIGCTVLAGGDAGIIPPLAIGSALMVMIFAGGHISGAHYNPAVTLGVWIRGKCPTSEVPGYMVCQVIGGVLAAVIAGLLRPDANPTPMQLDMTRALVAEFLYTFALVYVVLNVATAKANDGNSFYGLAIGFTVLTGAFSVGNISGGAFNPAVAVGISVMKLTAWPNLWIYLVGDFAGGAAAGMLFKMLNPADKELPALPEPD